MTVEAVLTILAILLGPIGALWVQRKLDDERGQKERQQRIFSDLMATRASRLSARHVDALNSIEVEFWSRGGNRVHSAWKEYLDHLNTPDSDLKKWGEKAAELMTTLLDEMSAHLGYGFEKRSLKRDFYAPQGHGQWEADTTETRQLVLELLRGNRHLWVGVSNDERHPVPVTHIEPAESKQTISVEPDMEHSALKRALASEN